MAVGNGKMASDYDLSNFETSQAELWIYLQFDAIVGQIRAERAERLGCPLAGGDRTVSAAGERPQALFNNGERDADRWARLRNQN
jgi:hypothetical protein